MGLQNRIIQRVLHRREQGFTLIEIIAVIGVMGILAAIAIPSYLNAVNGFNEKTVVGTTIAAVPLVHQMTINDGVTPETLVEAGVKGLGNEVTKLAVVSDSVNYCVLGSTEGSTYPSDNPFSIVNGLISEESTPCPVTTSDIHWE